MNPRSEIIASILSYSLCSGTLVLLNKLILHHLPYPSLVACFQLFAALVFVYVAQFLGYLEVDPIKWEYVKPYLYYTVAFAMGVYSNMKSLSVVNVETVIVFRSLTPCLVAFMDALFLGREYPSARSWLGLTLIVLGTIGYANFDVKFQTSGWAAYAWPSIYLCLISFTMAYGKRIIVSVDLKTRSGPVVYTNVLALFPMLIFAALGSEFTTFYRDRVEQSNPFSKAGILLLFLGCIAGTGIGYSSWWCRDKVSATSFTVVGVMNKCLTVLLNLCVWENHAPLGGIVSLFVCLVGGSLYRQAPLRKSSVIMGRDDSESEGEFSGTGKKAADLVEKGSWQQEGAPERMKRRHHG